MFLYGCCATKDLQPPSIPKAQAYTKEDYLISDEQRVVLGKKLSVEWWSLFAYDSLNNTIQQAIRDNYNIATAKAKLGQAVEAVKSTRGNLWPQLSLQAAAGRQKYGVAMFGPASIKIPPFTYYEIGPAVNWNIDLFGSTRHNIELKQALMQYQIYNLDATYLTLTSNVVAQALEIASVKAEITATKQIITEDEKTLQLIQKSFNFGTRNKIDILNAQSQLENDHALLPPLLQRLNTAKHALAILVGKPPANWSPPEFELESFVLPHELPITVPSELVKNRPDILAAQANLQAAGAAVGIAKANFYPSLVISANTLQEALTPHGLFLGASNAWAMAANLTAPLFSGGTLTAEKRKAEHAYKEMLTQYQQIILIAFLQVADALTALANDAKEITIKQRLVDVATESLKISYESFATGTIGLLQIQDKQRTLTRAQINLIQAKAQRYLDTVELFVALGGSPAASLKDPCYAFNLK